MPLSSANLGLVSQSKIPPLMPSIPEGEQDLYRFELLSALQSTLDIDGQLNILFDRIQSYVKVDGLSYQHNQHGIKLSLGDEPKHHCHYRLTADSERQANSEDLGEMQFSRGTRFGEEELNRIETVISYLLYPIRNALKYHVAVQTSLRDPLTGTGNRIALDNALHRECQLAERYDQSVSMIVVDIDHFKKINDNHGHSIGDEVLKEVANTIKRETRDTDMTFRYGGEEFVVVLSKTDLLGAGIIAERLRQSVEELTVATKAGDINVTVSLGTSKLQAQENIKSLFDRADQALYLAKENGRNCVISN